jgi:hypothetical protein
MSAPNFEWAKITAAYLESFNSGLFKFNCIAQKSNSKNRMCIPNWELAI